MSAIRTEPTRLERLEDGALWRVVLDAPPANVLDTSMIVALTRVFEEAATAWQLKAVTIEGEGEHFSYGASVAEHAPDVVGDMLPRFHAMFLAMQDAAVFTIAVVRGRCLGGGLEVAAFCHRAIAAPDAQLGQPEIQLGVFAPVASIVLPARVGYGAAADLCLSGRTVTADHARATGLVDDLAPDPGQAASDYAREHLLPRSASSLRHANRAWRHGSLPDFETRLRDLEQSYLSRLMQTHDAAEGIGAFLDKRKPVWSDA